MAKSWSIAGLRGVPGRPPEGRRDRPGATSAIVRQLFGNCESPWVAFGRPFGSIFAAGLCGTTKVTKFASYSRLAECFGCCCFDSFVFLAAPARERTLLKQGFRPEGVTFFACPAFARATKRRRNPEENKSKPYLTTCRKTHAERQAKTSKRERQMMKQCFQNRSRWPPEASSEPGWRLQAPKIASGGLWSIKTSFFFVSKRFFADF